MRILLTFFLLFMSVLSFGQTLEFVYGGQITNYETGKKESGVKISIVSNGKTLASSITASNGKYIVKFDSPAKIKYDIVFSKAGFVSKRVNFDLSKFDSEGMKEGEKYSPIADLSIEIFSVKPGIDFSFLENEPVAKFIADPMSAGLQLDVSASQRMKQKIEGLLDNSGNAVDNTDVKYNDAITKGDAYFKDGKLDDALKQFEAAAFLKSKEFYPQKKIAEIDALLKAKNSETYAKSETDLQYENYIKAADNFRDQKKYTEALSKYRAAMRVKNEQYPKDEVAKIEKIVDDLASAERNEKEYQAAITSGDAAMTSKQYDQAVKQFTAASGIRPNEQYPKDQIAAAQKALSDIAEKEENQKNYDASMKEGASLFTQSKFAEAKDKYTEALGFKPNENMPKERIKLCDEQLAKLDQAKKTEEEINALFEQGQIEIDAKSYDEAKNIYKKILGLDSKNILAPRKLDEIDRLIKADEDAKNAVARFDKYVADGDASVKSGDFASAKQHYGAALEVKQDQAVQDKFDAVVSKLVNVEAKELVQKKYDESIAEAKKLLDENELEKARLKYQNAASIDPSQFEPKLRIDEIDARLNKKSVDDSKYRAIIDKGDALMKKEKYLEAIKEFDLASEMRPAEQEPQDKSSEAARLARESKDNDNRQFERILTAARKYIDSSNYEKATGLVNRAITNRPAKKRPDDSRPEDMLKEILALEKAQQNYDDLIAEAGKLESAKDYKGAIDAYKSAGKVKPSESLPGEKIKELSEVFNNLMGKAEKEKKYQENFTKGVSEMGSKSYEMSLASFQKAQTFKPDDQVVQDKISEVQQILDDIAKAAENDKDRIAKVEVLIQEANALFGKKDWSQAKIKYKEVIALDAEQPFSLSRITECDLKLQEEMDALSEQAYKELVAQADNNFEKKDFLRSKELFEQANSKKPADDYPIKKLAELERLLNPTIVQTSSLKPLGDVYTGEDSELDLAKAEQARKNAKADQFLKTKNSAISKIEDETEKAKDKSYRTQRELNAIEEKTTEQKTIADARAHDLTEQVKTIQYSANTQATENAEYDKAQNLLAQEKLNYVREDLTIIKKRQNDKIDQKAADVKFQASAVSKDVSERTASYSQANINKGKQMSQISIEASEAMNDDESRALTEAQLKLVKESNSNKMASLSEDNQAKVEHNGDRFREIAASNYKREDAYDVNMEDKSQKLRKIEIDNIDNSREAYNRQMEKSLQAKDQINDQAKVSQRYALEEKEKHERTQAKVDNIKSKYAEEVYTRQTNSKDKNVHIQSNLDYMAIKQLEKSAEDNKKQNENAEVIKEINNKASEAVIALVEDKQDAQYSTQESLSKFKSANAAATKESVDKQLKNANALDDIQTIEEIRHENMAKKAEKNQQTTVKKLKESSTAPVVEKVKNTLGMEFPEGVTEEKFSQSKSDGTIHTIITRRIVVIDGHGDIYIRTQKDGVETFKKNGNSITKYAWQKETQGSNLVRH